jgi:hypothetical protein
MTKYGKSWVCFEASPYFHWVFRCVLRVFICGEALSKACEGIGKCCAHGIGQCEKLFSSSYTFFYKENKVNLKQTSLGVSFA